MLYECECSNANSETLRQEHIHAIKNIQKWPTTRDKLMTAIVYSNL